MKVSVEIPKIYCRRTTRELSKDEIYYSLQIVSGKMDGDNFLPAGKEAIFGRVSEVHRNVRKGTLWRPKLNDIELDIEDADAFSATLSLYERDDAKIYKEMQKEFNGAIDPEKFDWKSIIAKAKKLLIRDVNEDGNTDFEDIMSIFATAPALTPVVIGRFLFDVAKTAFKHFRQDDLLGSSTVVLNPNENDFDSYREFSFRKFGGKYDVCMKVNLI